LQDFKNHVSLANEAAALVRLAFPPSRGNGKHFMKRIDDTRETSITVRRSMMEGGFKVVRPKGRRHQFGAAIAISSGKSHNFTKDHCLAG
jgi:hypothetical protein